MNFNLADFEALAKNAAFRYCVRQFSMAKNSLVCPEVRQQIFSILCHVGVFFSRCIQNACIKIASPFFRLRILTTENYQPANRIIFLPAPLFLPGAIGKKLTKMMC